MSSERLRVIVIGLDGTTFDLILPWVKKGELPAFKQMMENGFWGELKSPLPPLTGPAWSSFMTGKNPGKHEIFDFMCRDPEGYDWVIINATRQKGPSFWRLLSDRGKQVIVFNVPVSYHLRGDPLFISNHWIEKFWLISGFHRARGIFLATGRPIKKGQKIEDLNIIDLAPTLLTLRGTPIPSDVDGRHVSGLFEEEFSERVVPVFAPVQEEPQSKERTLSTEEQAEIRKRPKSLGYIG